MEVQTYTEVKPQQQGVAPYGTVQEVRTPSKRKRIYVTPMQLLDLLWKTEQRHHSLKPSEKALLSALITYVNFDGIAYSGYESYPSTDLLIERLGNSKRNIEQNRKELQKNGWVKIVSGVGKGHANHYFINGPKIVESYRLSYPEDRRDFRVADLYEATEASPSKIKRNITGLMRGRSHPTTANHLVQ